MKFEKVSAYNFRTGTAGAAILALGAGMSLALASVPAIAQDHGSGHDSGSHSDAGDDHGSGGQKGKGRSPGESSGSSGHRSMEDIFRDVGGVSEDSDQPSWAGVGRRASGEATGGEGEEEDSDRPEWAGGKGGRNDRGEKPGDAGSARGDLYGDMYVILRDANGVPILNAQGFVQPIDKDGNLIPLDAEGAPIDPTLAQEVEIGRLNAARSPDQVLDQRAEEVVALLNAATAITTDAAGRLVVTSPDGTSKTIDAPLENMAIYVALMTQGTIPGVTDLPGTEYDHLVDGTLTNADKVSAVSFLAAAADKFTSLSLDAIAYENAILGISTTSQGTVTYSNVDYSAYSYDRSDTYSDVTASVLVKQPDGSYRVTDVNIYDAVFGSNDYTATGTFAAFATAVDDSRAVINYIHEYAIPADSLPIKE